VAGSAAQALCIQAGPLPVVRIRRIFLLHVYVFTGEVNHTQLVAADPAREDLLLAGFGIESPLIARFGQGNGEGPLFIQRPDICASGLTVRSSV